MKKGILLTFCLLLVFSFASPAEAFYDFMWDDMYETSEIEHERDEGSITYRVTPLRLDGASFDLDFPGGMNNRVDFGYGLQDDLEVKGYALYTGTFWAGVSGKYALMKRTDLKLSAGGGLSLAGAGDSITSWAGLYSDYILFEDLVLTNNMMMDFDVIDNELYKFMINAAEYDIDAKSDLRFRLHSFVLNFGITDLRPSFSAAYRRTLMEEVDFISYLETHRLGAHNFLQEFNNAVIYNPEALPPLEAAAWATLRPGGPQSINISPSFEMGENLSAAARAYIDTNVNSELILKAELEF